MKQMMTFNQHPFKSRQRGKSTIEFVSNSATGYVPLLKLIPTITGGSTDYLNVQQTRKVQTVLHEVNFNTTKNVFSFRKHLKEWSAVNNPMSTISMTMLSVLGFQGDANRLVSKGRRQGDGRSGRNTMMLTNVPDVFALAVIKISDIPKIDMSEGLIRIDPSLITILVSDYFTGPILESYNVTVAKYLRSNLRKVTRENQIEVKHISHDEMRAYHRNPYSIKNNSIFEIMEIDKKIKENVLTTITSQKLMEVSNDD